MKKIAITILILIVISFAGCGGSSSDPVQPNYSPPTDYPYKYLLCTRDYAASGCEICHH